MASGGIEEKDEIEKLENKTNTDRLKDEVKMVCNTFKPEDEVDSMPRAQLMLCMINVRKAWAAGTLVRTAGSVGGTPTGTPVRKKRVFLDIGGKES